jgi:hypothetical protein
MDETAMNALTHRAAALEILAATLEDKARKLLHDLQSLRTAVSLVQEELEILFPVKGQLG